MRIFDIKDDKVLFDEVAGTQFGRFKEIQPVVGNNKNRVLFAVDKGRFSGLVNLKPMEWDSRFFGRPLAKLEIFGVDNKTAGQQLIASVEERARSDGYRHLMARLEGPVYSVVWSLENNGYELVDMGITFILSKERWLFTHAAKPDYEHHIRTMEEKDLDNILSFGETLFRLSYFYRDPFFTTSEADLLHKEWIANLFFHLADVIWVCEVNGKAVGFVTCKIDPGTQIGTITLVGVHPDYTGQGIASEILRKSTQWFFEHGAKNVTVKTQSFNYPPINLYIKSGFLVSFSDITYCKTLR